MARQQAMVPIDQDIEEKPKKKKEKEQKPMTLAEKMLSGKFNSDLELKEPQVVELPKKRRTTKAKTDNIIKPDEEKKEDTTLPIYQSNVPYKTEYEETDYILKETIAQLNDLSMNIKSDIVGIKESKTLRNKYTYLNNLYSSYANTISAKISAVREMNSITTKAVELDLKRAKEFNMNNAVDDDKAVMDMYKSIISIPKDDPLSAYGMPVSHSMMTANVYPQQVMGANEDAIYQNYIANLTPEQKLMRYEDDPNVQTVVIYNKDTFEKRFAVMNVATGEEITGVPVRDTAMFMPDTTIDEAHGIARNVNLNETYPLIVIGSGDRNIEYY